MFASNTSFFYGLTLTVHSLDSHFISLDSHFIVLLRVFQNPGVCGQAFPSLPYPTPFLPPFCSCPIFRASRMRKTNTRGPNFVLFVCERLLCRLEFLVRHTLLLQCFLRPRSQGPWMCSLRQRVQMGRQRTVGGWEAASDGQALHLIQQGRGGEGEITHRFTLGEEPRQPNGSCLQLTGLCYPLLTQSRSQSFVPLDQRSENESSGSIQPLVKGNEDLGTRLLLSRKKAKFCITF